MHRSLALWSFALMSCVATPAPRGGAVSIELAQGRELVPLADGDPLAVERGCQGGWHVVVGLRISNAGDDELRVTIGLRDEGGDLVSPPASFVDRTSERGGRRDVPASTIVLDPLRVGPLRGRAARLSAVVARAGETHETAIDVRLVEGPSCEPPAPAPDAGPGPDAGVGSPSPLFVDGTERFGLTLLGDPIAGRSECFFDDPVSERPDDFCLPQRLVGGVAVGDVDGDRDGDVIVTRLRGLVLLENASGSLTDVTERAGLAGVTRAAGASLADVDGDRDLDLYVTRVGERSHLLFVNRGDGTFVEEGVARGASLATDVPLAGTTAAFGDVDRDGDADLFVGEWRRLGAMDAGPLRARMLANRGDGTFEDVTAQAGLDTTELWREIGSPIFPGVFALQPAIVDLDADGWPELALTSDYGTSAIFWNDGEGTFTRGALDTNAPSLFFGMGAAFADFDRDGAIEWIATGIHYSDAEPGNRLFAPSGPRTFVDRAVAAGVADGGWGWGVVALDADLDGDLDVAQTTGNLDAEVPSGPATLFLNDGRGRFSADRDVLAWLEQGRGIAGVDLDRDGDVDLVAARSEGAPRIFESRATERAHWLRVALVGNASGVEARGARVEITRDAGGPAELRIVGAEGGYLGGGELTVTVGLGERSEPVHEIRVTWPRTGLRTIVRDVAIDQELTVEER